MVDFEHAQKLSKEGGEVPTATKQFLIYEYSSSF